MARRNKAGPTRPCPHCSKPVHPRCKTCPYCHEAIRVATENTSPPKKKVATKTRTPAAPTDQPDQLAAENAQPEEVDWVERLQPTYD
jgi:hypothetical protein